MSQTLPCRRCLEPVPAAIFEDELGFCLDCSNLYWDDLLDPVTLEKKSSE